MKTHTTLGIIFCFTLKSLSQNAPTNTYNGILESNGTIDFKETICEISSVYKIRFAAEFTAPIHDISMAFTNESLTSVMEFVVNINTNYTWKYDNQTDRIYIHPKTNSVFYNALRFDLNHKRTVKIARRRK